MRSIFFTLLILLALTVKGVCMIDMDIIAEIESSNNPNAYNKASGAVGLYQQLKICVDDYNDFHYNKFKHKDMFIAKNSEKVCKWYIEERLPTLLKHYKVPVTVKHILYSYNFGAKNVQRWYQGKKALPKETKEYYEKYMQLL